MKKPLFLGGFFVCASVFLSLMLTGLCGGFLMLGYQKSSAAAQPHQHPNGGAHTRGVLKQALVLIAQQVLLYFPHGVTRQLGHDKTLLRNFEIRQL